MNTRSPGEGTAALVAATRVVDAVVGEGRSAEDALDAQQGGPAVQAIALGTLRWFQRLSPAFDSLLDRPGADTQGIVKALLVTAAHQIGYSRNAPQGVVDAAVDATRSLGVARASGLVNAVLRRYVRERGAIHSRLDSSDLAVLHSHPRWLVKLLQRDWPEQARTILAGNNLRAPMTLRVDLSRTSVAQVLETFAAQGIAASAIEGYPAAVELEAPKPVEALPGFDTGLVSVQDAAAQLAAALLAPQPGQRVLDACAAPGGKTVHLLEAAGGEIDLLAVDIDAGRLEWVEENLARCGRRARLAALDLADPDALADEAPFDRILVDAPCSGTGVIRRHPDIKLLRRPADIARFAQLQARLLANLFPKLAPGGRLVYATCSVLKDENDGVLAGILAAHPQAKVLPLPAHWAPRALPTSTGGQLLPAPGAPTDGFHYAVLTRLPG